MRKILLVVVAMAMVVSFLPKAEAQDPGSTAELGVAVTFNLPLRMWCEKDGAVIDPPVFEVDEGKELTFMVIAEDLDAHVTLRAEALPKGADFELLPRIEIYPNPRHEGMFNWTPAFGQAQSENYLAIFKASNDEGNAGLEMELAVSITVHPGQPPVMAIEIQGENPWVLGNIKPGGPIKRNLDDAGNVIHSVMNTGDIPTVVKVEYMPHVLNEAIHPGLERGENTFITLLGEVVLPPNLGLKLDHPLNPGDSELLPLGYGSPTILSPKDSVGHEYGLQFIASEPIIDIP